MKKLIIGLMIATALLMPSASYAYTLTQEQRISFQMLITELLKQVQVLIQQLAALQAQQATLSQQKSTPSVSPTPSTVPIQTAPNYQGIIRVTMEDKSAISAVMTKHTAPDEGIPYGVYQITVYVLDSNGNRVHLAPVTPNMPDDIWNSYSASQNAVRKTGNETTGNDGKGNGDWYTYFPYTPSSKGTKTLTFTSGSLTKTVTVEVN